MCMIFFLELAALCLRRHAETGGSIFWKPTFLLKYSHIEKFQTKCPTLSTLLWNSAKIHKETMLMKIKERAPEATTNNCLCPLPRGLVFD